MEYKFDCQGWVEDGSLLTLGNGITYWIQTIDPEEKSAFLNYVKKHKPVKSGHIDDWLSQQFYEHVKIQNEVAERIGSFDVISPNCLYVNEAQHQPLIDILRCAEVELICFMKHFKSADKVDVSFVAIFQDMSLIYEVISGLRNSIPEYFKHMTSIEFDFDLELKESVARS